MVERIGDAVSLPARRALPSSIAVAATTAAAAWWFSEVFVRGAALVPLVSVVAAVSVALAALRVRRDPTLPPDLLVGGAALVSVIALIAEVRSADAVTDLRAGLVDGWARILTTEAPVPGRMDLLAAPLVVVGVATLLAQLATFRSRSAWLPVVPGLLLAGAGLAFGDSSATQPWTAVLLFTLASGSVALLRRGRPVGDHLAADDGPSGRRSPVPWGGVATLVAAAVVATVVLPSLPGYDASAPFSLRRYVDIRRADRRLPSPVTRAQQLAGSGPVMEIRAMEPVPAGTRVRVATLDSFDGVGWRSTGRLAPSGPELSGKEPSGTEVTVEVAPLVLEVPWVPTIGRPTSVQDVADPDATIVLWSPDSSNVATQDLSPSDGTTWRVSGVVPSPRPEELAVARLDPPTPLDLGDRMGADEVQDLLAEAIAIVGGDPGGFAAAARLAAFFRNDPAVNTGAAFAVDPDAPTIQSLGATSAFLDSRVGSPLQFSLSYATLARLAGLPVRVAVGAEVAALEEDDAVQIDGSALGAWAEVHVAGVGWVAVDPVPDTEGDVAGAAEQQVDEAIDEVISSPVDDQPPSPKVGVDGDESPDAGRTSTGFLVVLVGVFLLLVLVASAPSVLRAARRRRRALGTASERISGAWMELLDLFAERGERRPLWATPSETGRLLAGDLDANGQHHLQQLTVTFDRAVYGSVEPVDTDADRAWELLRLVRRGRLRTTWVRLRSKLSWRPLRMARL